MSAATSVALIAVTLRVLLQAWRRWFVRILVMFLITILPAIGGILYLWFTSKQEHGLWVWVAVVASFVTTFIGFAASARYMLRPEIRQEHIVVDESGKTMSYKNLSTQDIDGLIKAFKEDRSASTGSETPHQPPQSNGPTKE